MNVLYLQTDSSNALDSSLLAKRTYDRLFTDFPDQREGLNRCLKSLSSGDTLYVEREACLSETMPGAVRLLRDLAARGVNVWCERSNKLFDSRTSPFKSISEDVAQAIVDFRNEFMRLRQKRGIDRARAEGRVHRSPRVTLPDCFPEACRDWIEGRITLMEGAARCEMSVSTFWKKARYVKGQQQASIARERTEEIVSV